MSKDTKSPENLYLIGTLLLFLILPFQNCTLSPVDIAWAEGDPGYRVELQEPKETAAVKSAPTTATASAKEVSHRESLIR